MAAALLTVAAGCLSIAAPASAATPCGTNGAWSAAGNVESCTYTAGGEDTFTVPLFVTAVNIVAVGQNGGTGCAFEIPYTTGFPGSGARVAATVPVTQPTYFVEVPPAPAYSGPCGAGGDSQITISGGGGGGTGLAPGGGASAIQRCSVNSNCPLTGAPQTDPRLVVAGGGGGAAFRNANGGDAGTGGNLVCNPGQSGQGAPPGDVSGGGGTGGGCQGFGIGGQGGTGPGGISTDGSPGGDGGILTGGDGGDIALTPVQVPGCDYPWRGAGGGNGFWGGGGGGGAAYCNGGGGGGGSSYAESVASNVAMTLAGGATPSVTISWVEPQNREYQFLTGRAFGLSYTQSPPTPAVTLTTADTGYIETSQSWAFTAPCVPIQNDPVWSGTAITTVAQRNVCAEVKTTGGSQLQSSSLAAADEGLLTLVIPGVTTVRARTVLSYSKTTCAASTGATFISYLAVGGDVVISQPTTIAPNKQLTIGQVHLTLNEQTPFTHPAERGLDVVGIDLSFGPPSSLTGHLIVASAESDIGDCPGQLPF